MRVRVAVALLVCAIAAAACGGGSSSTSNGRRPRSGTLTSAELKYGLAPDDHPNVTYQRDVVVVGGGAASVVRATADGKTWTVKADAPHVSDLAVGKVMVLTNQATGRILTLNRTSAGVVVELIPVQLGEVFERANLSFNVPIASDEIGFQQVPQEGGESSDPPPGNPAVPGATAAPTAQRTDNREQPNRVVLAAAGGLSGGLFGQAFGSYPAATGFAGDAHCGAGSGSGSKPVPQAKVTDPFVNTNGVTFSPALEFKSGPWNFEAERLPGQIAVRGAYALGPIRFGIVFRIFGSLSLSGTDSIVGGKEHASGIRLNGIKRMTIGFVGGTSNGASNLRSRIDIPIDLEILTRQLYVDGIPMVVAVKPKFVVETAFSANNSTLWACGDYDMQVGPKNGNDGVIAKFFKATKSLLPINGVSIGVNGVVIAFDLKFQAGLGIKGAYSGPFSTFTVAVGATRGSDLGIVNCQSADLVISGKAGVGFSLSTKAVTALMRRAGRAYVGGNIVVAQGLQKLANGLRLMKDRLDKGGELDFDRALYAGTIYEAHKTVPDVPICKG